MSIKNKIALMAGMAALFDSGKPVSKSPETREGATIPKNERNKRKVKSKMQKQSRKTNRRK